jgi:hypothetical protein
VHATAILAGSGNEMGLFCCTKMVISRKRYASMNYYFWKFFSREGGIRFRCVWHFCAVFYGQSILKFHKF